MMTETGTPPGPPEERRIQHEDLIAEEQEPLRLYISAGVSQELQNQTESMEHMVSMENGEVPMQLLVTLGLLQSVLQEAQTTNLIVVNSSRIAGCVQKLLELGDQALHQEHGFAQELIHIEAALQDGSIDSLTALVTNDPRETDFDDLKQRLAESCLEGYAGRFLDAESAEGGAMPDDIVELLSDDEKLSDTTGQPIDRRVLQLHRRMKGLLDDVRARMLEQFQNKRILRISLEELRSRIHEIVSAL